MVVWCFTVFSSHEHLDIKSFIGADWVGSKSDGHSTSGYCTLLGGNLVSWNSKKQPAVASSSAKVEYHAIAHGTCELANMA